MNQVDLESNLIITLIRDILKNKFFMLALLGIMILIGINHSNSRYLNTCKLSPLFVKEVTNQIIEMDEIVKLNNELEKDDLQEYSKNLTVSAYVDGSSREEREIISFMSDFRRTAYDAINSNRMSRNVQMRKYNDSKLVLMYELNSKRKSYSDLDVLWDIEVFEIE